MFSLAGVLRFYSKRAAVLVSMGLLLEFATLPSRAQDQPKRPLITGIDHVRVYVSEAANTQQFYTNFFNFPADEGGCREVSYRCFPVNSRQQIEIQRVSTLALNNWLAEIGFATDDVEQMRRYLLAHGIDAGPMSTKLHAARHFELRDPEGNQIAFIQRSYPVDQQAVVERPSEQVSTRLLHAGFVVKDRVAENRFYVDLLGFRLYWYGGFKDEGIDWYEIQVPDGPDWIEYMLNIPANADHKELGVQNHFSFGVKDVHATAAKLRASGLQAFDGPEIGRDGKDSLDAYDPDGTRVEIMEFTPAQKPCCHPYTAEHPKP